MGSTLLMTGKKMPYPVLIVEKLVVGGHYCSARIAKNCIHAFLDKTSQDRFGTSDSLAPVYFRVYL